jgi:hypothetical protein
MIRELGSYNTSGTRTHVRFQFSTHAAAGGNVAPLSAFEGADIRIYKAADGAAFSATQRSSSNGITMTSPFDSLTGVHDVDIDLTDNTDAGFYAAGCRYSVVLSPDTETVDSQTITGVVLAEFEIGPPPANVIQIAGTTQTAKDLGAINVTNLNTLSGHDPGATLGTSTLTQSQVTGGAYSIQSSSCVLGDARIANLDAAVSTRGTSTLTQTQVTGGAYSIQSSSCVLGDARIANLDAAVSTRGTSTLTQAQVTGGAYSVQSSSCVLGDTRIANLDAAVSTRLSTVGDVTLATSQPHYAPAKAGDAMTLDLTQAVPTSNTAETLGDCLNSARAQGFGKWVVDGIAKTLKLYANDGTTVVKTFSLDSITEPLSRTPV